MFDTVKLTRPDLTIAALNDGRHKLDPANPQDRESIPLVVHLPEEGIAFFTYTWVNSASEAGAAIALFGPGIGPEQIMFGMADRKIPEDMNFSEWKIDGYAMEHDLAFKHAHCHFKNERVEIEFTFEGAHPPYAYGANAGGCPPYCANNCIEQSGRVKGSLVIDGRRIDFDTTGHRDHSWGTRDWKAMQNYRWFEGQAGPETALHFWHLNALGETRLLGYVVKDGLMAEITALDFEVTYDANYFQDRITATVTDEAGRTTHMTTDFKMKGVLVPSPDIVLNEAGGTMMLDGKPGVGWLEHAWPTDYLAHIRSVPAYAPRGK